jgi:hypothetical protein
MAASGSPSARGSNGTHICELKTDAERLQLLLEGQIHRSEAQLNPRTRRGRDLNRDSPGVPVFSRRVPETRAFPALLVHDSEPETVAGDAVPARTGMRSPFKKRRFGFGSVWLRLAQAEQLRLCCPCDRKVHGPDQTMGGQFGGLPSGGESLRQCPGPGRRAATGC